MKDFPAIKKVLFCEYCTVMRSAYLILLLLAFCLHANSQAKQASYLGNASWRRVTGMKEREPLAVNQRSFPVKKITYQDKPVSLYTKKIDPGTVILHRGPTIPLTQQIRITGKKLPTPKIIPAPPLLTRDNAAFNISYTDKKHGFVSNTPMDFAEDEEHAIWIGSEKGLIRYDGYHYYLYEQKNSFPDMPDCSLAYDPQKRLWWATDNGVFFIKNDSIFSIQSPEIDLSAIACKRVLVDRLQRVWISTKNNGILCIDGANMKVYDKRCGLPGNYVESVYLDRKGNLYVACRDFGVVLIEPDKMRSFFSNNKTMKYPIFISFYEDEEGIWAGSFLSGLMRLGPTDTLQYSITGKFNEAVYDIKKAPGGIWVSCHGAALAYLSKDKLLLLNENNGLLSNYVLKLFEDSFQNIWVSNGYGISRINENCFYLDNFANPAMGYIRNIIPDNKKGGNWYITFGRNLLFQKGKEITAYTHKTATGIQPFNYTNAGVLNRDGTIWMGSYGEGIVHVSETTFTRYTFSDFTDYGIVVSVKTDSANKVWFCPTRYGLIVHDNNRFWRYTKESGLLSNDVTNLLLDAEKKIYWTFPEGLQRLHNNNIETFYVGNRVFRDHVNDMLTPDHETMLLATSANGLIVIQKQQAYQLATGHGLSSNMVRSITRDSSGKIWITTEKGIECFRLKNLSLSDHNVFNESNGSYILDAENSFLDAAGNPYWVAGTQKLIFNADFTHTKSKAPVFSFKQIDLDNQPLSFNDDISILPDQKIKLNYKTIFWGRENNLRLTYLLISNQQDTTERSVQNNGSIIISDVLPGNYRIILKGNDNNQVYYSSPINITVRNFWYNTWVFRVFGALFIIAGIISYFRWKANLQIKANKRLETRVAEQTSEILKEKEELQKSYEIIGRQNQEKDALIQEINHRVKNNLQLIAAMVEMQLSHDYSKETLTALLGTSRRLKAMSLVHELLYYKKDVQGLSTLQYIHELVNNLKQITSDEEHPIHFRIDVEDIYLDSRSALSIGMIISELVSNSFKYAFNNIASPEITISLTKDSMPGYFQLLVADNGNGVTGNFETLKNLGSRLVDIFSRQLAGTYTLDHDSRFVFILHFKPIAS